MQRTALLIDGANMSATANALRFRIDYQLLLDELNKEFDVVRAIYYTAIRPNDGSIDDPLIKLLDWLTFHGFTIVSKSAKEYDNKEGHVIKGNMDVEMVLDAIQMSDRIDHFVLGTGDGDFRYLVEVLHKKGIEVSAISTIKTSPPMIANSLRREVDRFFDLDDIRDKITRERS
jgi:uncharacterized LabA/DUF88 family protein